MAIEGGVHRALVAIACYHNHVQLLARTVGSTRSANSPPSVIEVVVSHLDTLNTIGDGGSASGSDHLRNIYTHLAEGMQSLDLLAEDGESATKRFGTSFPSAAIGINVCIA